MSALILAALLALPAVNTWTVDDDGPADFPDIASAVQTVPAGDTLLVQPGTYEAFTLGKRLSILGATGGARPHVTGRTEVAGAVQVSLGGLHFDSLTLWSLPGNVVVDDCKLGPLAVPDGDAALEINACHEALVSRSTIEGGQTEDVAMVFSQPGLRAIGSVVTVVDCTIVGGAGRDGDQLGEPDGGHGGDAVIVRGGSIVTLAGCPSILGGRSGECVGFVCQDGIAGDGVAVVDDSLVVVRGESSDTLDAGSCWCGPPFGGQHGHALLAMGATAVVSGVAVATLNPLGIQADGGSQVVQPAVAEPFIEMDGGLVAGDGLALHLHGPAGSTALLIAAPQLALLTVGGYEGALWVNPASLLLLAPVVLAGQDTPVTLAGTLPATPGLEGLLLAVQTAHPGLQGALDPTKKLMGNALPLLVRF
jgi:hypothetical protein